SNPHPIFFSQISQSFQIFSRKFHKPRRAIVGNVVVVLPVTAAAKRGGGGSRAATIFHPLASSCQVAITALDLAGALEPPQALCFVLIRTVFKRSNSYDENRTVK
ncbi:hypothetical protein Tsubulata_041587, partial [Turnera subulata]